MGRKHHPLAARIKRLMQADEDVGKISAVSPILIGRAVELFLKQACEQAGRVAGENGAKTATPSHLKAYVMSETKMDFLKDKVANVADMANYAAGEGPPPKQRRVSASQLGDGKACGSGDTDAPAVRGRGRGSRGGGRGGGRGRGRTVRQPSLTAAAPAPAGPSPLPDAAAAHAAHAGTMAGPPDAAGVHGPGALPTCTAERCPGGGSGALPAAGASAHAGASAGSAACPATTAAQRSEVLRRKPAFLYARGGGTGPLGAGRGGARTAFAFKSSTANSSTAKAGTAAVAAAVPRAGTVLPGSAASAPDTADTGVVLAAATSECRGAAPHLSAVIPEEDDYDAD